MEKRIVIIHGHPDPQGNRFGHALADAYTRGAEAAGHRVVRIEIARLDFPLLRTKEEFEQEAPPPAIAKSQEAIRRADHLVIFYPLWLGAIPALLKGFLEQTFRPGFAARERESGALWEKLLTGKSARIVVTMGIPAWVYRWYFGAHSLKSLKRDILGFSGIKPVKETLVGGVEAIDDAKRQQWLRVMEDLGAKAR